MIYEIELTRTIKELLQKTGDWDDSKTLTDNCRKFLVSYGDEKTLTYFDLYTAIKDANCI